MFMTFVSLLYGHASYAQSQSCFCNFILPLTLAGMRRSSCSSDLWKHRADDLL